jgi:hypothetical protein
MVGDVTFPKVQGRSASAGTQFHQNESQPPLKTCVHTVLVSHPSQNGERTSERLRKA